VPTYSIGEVIRHILTGEQAEIVRIVNTREIFARKDDQRPDEPAYIVRLPADPLAPAREALWTASEAANTSSAIHAPGDERGSAPNFCWICGKVVMSKDRISDNFGKPSHRDWIGSDSIPIHGA